VLQVRKAGIDFLDLIQAPFFGYSAGTEAMSITFPVSRVKVSNLKSIACHEVRDWLMLVPSILIGH
jgi:hypothetical protein